MAAVIPWRAVMALSLVGLGLSAMACSDRLLDQVIEPEHGEPVCMLALSYGHWDDGRMTMVIEEPLHLLGAGCACLPPEDRHAWDQESLDMLAELALAECERIAREQYDFDWNDCRADYEAGVWEDYTDVVIDGAYGPDDLYCTHPLPD